MENKTSSLFVKARLRAKRGGCDNQRTVSHAAPRQLLQREMPSLFAQAVKSDNPLGLLIVLYRQVAVARRRVAQHVHVAR